MKALIFFLAVLNFQNCFAQDPQFVQTHSNALYLNPALTGCFISPVISQSYRIQWPKLNGTYNTYSAAYHQFVRLLHGGLGCYYLYDDAGEGTMKTNRYNISYAAHFEIKNKLVLRAGFTGGYVNRKIDWDKLTFGDMIDPRYGFIYPTTETSPPSSLTFFDCGIGTVAYMKNFYLGCAIDHINEPEQTFIRSSSESKLSKKILVNAGLHFPLGDSTKQISINPDLVYLSQRDFNQTIASVTARLKYFLIGTGLRVNTGLMFSLGFENKFLRLSYCFDATRSALANATAGSHEFFLGFKIYGIHPNKGKWTPINMEAF
jgi:type IX secretion system PorP/SprF family membrane protein